MRERREKTRKKREENSIIRFSVNCIIIVLKLYLGDYLVSLVFPFPFLIVFFFSRLHLRIREYLELWTGTRNEINCNEIPIWMTCHPLNDNQYRCCWVYWINKNELNRIENMEHGTWVIRTWKHVKEDMVPCSNRRTLAISSLWVFLILWWNYSINNWILSMFTVPSTFSIFHIWSLNRITELLLIKNLPTWNTYVEMGSVFLIKLQMDSALIVLACERILFFDGDISTILCGGHVRNIEQLLPSKLIVS